MRASGSFASPPVTFVARRSDSFEPPLSHGRLRTPTTNRYARMDGYVRRRSTAKLAWTATYADDRHRTYVTTTSNLASFRQGLDQPTRVLWWTRQRFALASKCTTHARRDLGARVQTCPRTGGNKILCITASPTSTRKFSVESVPGQRTNPRTRMPKAIIQHCSHTF